MRSPSTFFFTNKISHTNQQTEIRKISSQVRKQQSEIHLSLSFFVFLFYMKRALRSPCSCHRLNSRWHCLLNQTHKVPLFHSFTSISHGNCSSFVSATTTAGERSRQRERKRFSARMCNLLDTVEKPCRIMGCTSKKQE